MFSGNEVVPTRGEAAHLLEKSSGLRTVLSAGCGAHAVCVALLLETPLPETPLPETAGTRAMVVDVIRAQGHGCTGAGVGRAC